MWKNTTEIEETVQRAGVDVKRTGWKCNACDNVFWNRNKSRKAPEGLELSESLFFLPGGLLLTSVTTRATGRAAALFPC